MTVSGPVPADSAGRDRMVAAMCAAVDRGDAEGFASWFAADARYRFGNSAATIGRSAVLTATEGAANSLPWVRHTVDQIAHLGDQLFCRFTISTADPAGTEVDLPCVTVIWIAHDEIVDYQVTMDLAPAFSMAR
ncbi:MAG TPA: nuclear transport factor 2 family protein [Galbitalea sp.]|nr:nuclear transport factor 2 family protein [Galbitalea sp.]